MTHYEERLERDLAKLAKRVRRMGGAVVGAVRSATKSALTLDGDLANQTILGDLPINRQARELDHRCHIFIARHLPSAGHLRQVSSAMRLSKTLERVGDYAETMSRASVQLSSAPPESVRGDIEMMGRHAANTLELSLEAYCEGSVEKARATRAVVGQYGSTFDKVFSDLVEAGKSGSQPMEDLFALMAIFNRLERILHQAKNVCEQTLFYVTGEKKDEKTFDVLFVDSRNVGASALAEHYCRKAYPEAGTFESAGWDIAKTPDQKYIEYADTLGLDLRDIEARSFEQVLTQVADYDLIIDLAGGVRSHLTRIPFHTVILSWPLSNREDPAEVFEQLSPQISDLMELLRGEEED
jgi:phosphate transport system protein